MDFGKPATPIHRGASSDDATMPATTLLRPRRLGGLRLALAAASLGMVLWVLAGTFTWQVPKYSGSADQVLLTTLNSSTEDLNATPQHSPESNSTTTTDSTKECEKMSMGHIEKEFYHPESCFSRTDIQQIIIKGLVWTLADVLTHSNIPYWLDSGTLLGSHREKTVIPYDHDSDIGVSEASCFQLRGNQFNFSSEYELQVFEGKFHRQGPRDVYLPAHFIHKGSGLYVDIFVFRDNSTDPATFEPPPSVCFHGCFRCSDRGKWTKEFAIPRDWVFPLQQCWFGGRMASCPVQPEKYLEHLYGSDYMTPKVE